MRIHIETGNERNINISLPTALIINRLTASLAVSAIKGHLKKEGTELPFSPETAGLIVAELARWRREHGPLVLVDVVSVNGDTVLITI